MPLEELEEFVRYFSTQGMQVQQSNHVAARETEVIVADTGLERHTRCASTLREIPSRAGWRMCSAAAAAAQLRGKTGLPPAKGGLTLSQRASLWNSTARSRRRSSVHAGACERKARNWLPSCDPSRDRCEWRGSRMPAPDQCTLPTPCYHGCGPLRRCGLWGGHVHRGCAGCGRGVAT